MQGTCWCGNFQIFVPILVIATSNQINSIFNSVCEKEVHYPKAHKCNNIAIIYYYRL